LALSTDEPKDFKDSKREL
jgi:hypothetical protein